jgi:type II secretory pathway pseudopilin PulG
MKNASRGYALLMMLLMLAVIGLVAASQLQLGLFGQRRLAELQLLEAGARMDEALASYARLGQGGRAVMPERIEDLLRDPRFPKLVVRHLRQIEMDPITGKPSWGIVKSEDGKGIVGFHSLSEQKPLMTVFGPDHAHFKDLPRYSDWVFGNTP